MATNHGVGGSNPSSPTTGPKGFPSGGRKIMIGIADPKLWNLGLGLLPKWSGLLFIIYRIFTFIYSIPGQKKISIFFLFYAP